VTIVASRRNDQAFFEEADAVNAFAVIFENIVLGDIVHIRHRRALAMALAAEIRNVHFKGGRFRRAAGQNVVGAVAILAGWRVRRFAIQRLAVNAGVKIHLRVVVARGAINRLESFRMGEFFHRGVDVAGNTFDLLVNRFAQGFHIHKERNLLAAALGGERRVGVAFEAGVVGLGMQDLKTKKREQNEYKPASFHCFISKKMFKFFLLDFVNNLS
jgi:hypothetical protein